MEPQATGPCRFPSNIGQDRHRLSLPYSTVTMGMPCTFEAITLCALDHLVSHGSDRRRQSRVRLAGLASRHREPVGQVLR